MPLSEREQRILEDIEKGLHDEDPEFAREATRRSPVFASDRRRIRAGVAVAIVGFISLIAFFVTSNIIFGVVAFGGMVLGIVLAAGPMSGFLNPKRFSDSSVKDRLSSTARSFEEKMKGRNRKRR